MTSKASSGMTPKRSGELSFPSAGLSFVQGCDAGYLQGTRGGSGLVLEKMPCTCSVYDEAFIVENLNQLRFPPEAVAHRSVN